MRLCVMGVSAKCDVAAMSNPLHHFFAAGICAADLGP